MKVPPHWKLVTLNDIAKWGSGGTPKSTVKEYYDGDIPWLIIGDLNDSYVNTAQKHITRLGLENSSAKIISPNSVLVAMYGSIGKLGINKIPLSCNQAIAYTKELSDNVSNLFLFYYLMSIREKLHSLGKGGTQKNISQTVLKKVDFPLPPIGEQNRIVNKIESLLSELDSSIENLQRAKEKLKLYRQSVLKSAFEGKLTEAWRQDHADELEDAEVLLVRIKQEREAAYEESLAEWEASVKAWEEGGKVGKKPAKPKKPKELPPLSGEELEALPELPEGWKWIQLLNITQDFSLGKMLDKQKNKGVLKPYIGNINVRWGSFDLHNLKEMRFEKSELYKYGLKKGDLIVCEGGEPGRCSVWNIDRNEIGFQKALHRVRFSLQNVLPEFIYYYFLHSSQNGKLEKFFTGTTIKHLTGQGLSKVEIPICSKMEQIVLVESVQKLFNKADILEKTIATSLKKAESLRQSILKSAFEGRLVSYEPAITSLFKSPPKPVNIVGISSTDLHAGIIALTYKMHQERGYLDKLNHVKHEKIAHLTESIVGIDLGRAPVQDAAGPDDYNHLKKVEHRARMARWFTTEKERIGYRYKPLQGFDRCIAKTKEALGEHLERVERLVTLMLPMDMERAEIFATTYAAWNNMLIDGLEPTDDEIVYKAREEWSSRKLTLERERFFKALEWMREKGIVPSGNGKYVKPTGKKK